MLHSTGYRVAISFSVAMTTVLAIDASADASFQAVTAQLTADGKIRILEARTLDLQPPEVEAGEEVVPAAVDLAVDITEVDEIFATAPIRGSYSAGVSLPFSEQKKVEIVAPLQLQDTLPFDLDGFTVVTTPTGRAPKGDFRFLTSILPDEVIKKTLSLLKRVGLEPRVLTTGASAIAGLARASHPSTEAKPRAYLYVASQTAALVVIRGEELLLLRDFLLIEHGEADVLRSVNCAIAKLERDLGERLEVMRILATDTVTTLAEQILSSRPTRWDISGLLAQLTTPGGPGLRNQVRAKLPFSQHPREVLERGLFLSACERLQVELELAPVHLTDFNMQRVGVQLRAPSAHELPIARIRASPVHGSPQAARMTRDMVAR